MHTIAKTPMVLAMRIIGYQRIIDQMNHVAKTYPYDSAKYVGAITYGVYGTGERCLHDDVVNFEEVPFEDRMYQAPGGYDKYLTQIYGDYMSLPPEEKRIDHKMKVWMVFDA